MTPQNHRSATETQRKTARQQLGARSERLAERFLTSHGYRIEARNVRYPVGELDLVAWDGDTLCFIEVRATCVNAVAVVPGTSANVGVEPKDEKAVARPWALRAATRR